MTTARLLSFPSFSRCTPPLYSCTASMLVLQTVVYFSASEKQGLLQTISISLLCFVFFSPPHRCTLSLGSSANTGRPEIFIFLKKIGDLIRDAGLSSQQSVGCVQRLTISRKLLVFFRVNTCAGCNKKNVAKILVFHLLLLCAIVLHQQLILQLTTSPS